MSVIEDLHRQRRMIRRDGRTPDRIVAHPDAVYDLMCETTFAGPSLRPLPDGVLGYILGLPVYPSDRPGAMVLSSDWPGFGQGAVRG